jgi:hypothetical protein
MNMTQTCRTVDVKQRHDGPCRNCRKPTTAVLVDVDVPMSERADAHAAGRECPRRRREWLVVECSISRRPHLFIVHACHAART